jgi:hypothetical protein
LSNLEEGLELGPRIAVVSEDPPGHRALLAATGAIEPVLLLVRDPGKDSMILAVGAHVAHHEVVATGDAARTDAAWRVRLKGGVARSTWVGAFRAVH